VPYHQEGQDTMVETDRLEDDFDDGILINGKPIRRFFCYLAASSTLNSQYKVHYNKVGEHAHIYSPKECDLIAPVPRPKSSKLKHEVYLGCFPYIGDMEWKFCCSLLNCSKAQHDKLKTTKWVDPVYDDPLVANVYDVTSEQLSSTVFVESCNKSREIMEWMENNMIHLPFAYMLKFPGGFQCIIDQVSEFYSETNQVSSAVFAREILKELERLNMKDNNNHIYI
jgi:hypothetical protein